MTAAILTLSVGGLSLNASDAPAGTPVAVTTSDPSIPTEELALLLVPLNKQELLVEADGWQ